MRVGLVGAGRFGRRYLQTLATLPELRLAGVASRNPETPALLPPGCPVHADWRSLLAAGGLDGLLVVTPPPTHAAITAAAMEAGLAVLVEKPLTLDRAEAEALLALPRRAPVMVEHTHLFAPACRALCELAAGAATEASVEAGAHGPFRRDVPVLWDWGAHWVAVCLELFGAAPIACAARLARSEAVAGGLGQQVELQLRFEGERRARISLSNLREQPCRRLTVRTAREDMLVYDELAAAPLERTDPAGYRNFPPVSEERPLRAALRAFASAWRGRDDPHAPPPPSDLALGVAVVRVLAACEAALARDG